MAKYYKCFCEADYHDLKKEEIWRMLRATPLRYTPDEFMRYYGIKEEEYSSYLRYKGLVLTSEDRKIHSRLLKKKEKQQSKDPNENLISFPFFKVEDVPKLAVLALYEIPYDIKDGEFYYDIQRFKDAQEHIENKVDAYLEKMKEIEEDKRRSKLRPIDLIAMRAFRGFSRKEAANELGLTLNMITEIESRGHRVLKREAELYIKTFNIKKRHMVQLREVMAGKRDNIEDNREIPALIKVRVWARDEGKCSNCGNENNLHYHHKKRFSDGGRHTLDNLTLLCVNCHAEEHKGEQSYWMLKKMAEEAESDE